MADREKYMMKQTRNRGTKLENGDQ